MRMKANLIGAMSAVVILGAASVANAQTGETRGAQGLESVEKNIAKDKDSDKHGLTNAQQHIKDNMARKAAKTAHAKDKDKARHDDKAMRAEKAERAEKADRPERPERPERAGRS